MREHARFAKCDATIGLSVLLKRILRSKSLPSEATCNFYKSFLKSGFGVVLKLLKLVICFMAVKSGRDESRKLSQFRQYNVKARL